MKHILVLGAGQSAPFLIARLLELSPRFDWRVTVADLDPAVAERRVAGHDRGQAIAFDVNDGDQRNRAIASADVVINMLSPRLLDLVAWSCLSHGKPLLAVSYRTRAIREMHDDAARKGVLILTELGLDPGIDHMSAMELIARLREEGGRIRAFRSYGSGIPAPEAAADNPLRYVVTWNPRNVVMSAENGAQYMERGRIKCVPWQHVFHHTWHVDVEGVGRLEAYPNRDSLSYMQSFGLDDAQTMIRGTLRWPGWSETWARIVELGLPNEHLRIPGMGERSYREVLEMFLPLNLDQARDGADLERRVAGFLDISPTGHILDNLRWLGLFSDERVLDRGETAASMLTDLIARKMRLRDDERDMVILMHELEVDYPGREAERVTSTLVNYGDPGGFTAMAKSVGLPVVVATKLLLTGAIDLVGAHLPLHPSVYTPSLRELADEGLCFVERRAPLSSISSATRG